MLSTTEKSRLWELLFETESGGEPVRVFVVLDGATVRKLPDYFEDSDIPHFPIVPPESDSAVEVTRTAYLAELERGSAMAEWLATEGWGCHWGIYVTCPESVDPDDLLNHLRELSQVRLPDGRIVFFRFYDPRVWRLFMTTCDAQQSGFLFELPIRFGCENEDGSDLLTYGLSDGAVERSVFRLKGHEPTDIVEKERLENV